MGGFFDFSAVSTAVFARVGDASNKSKSVEVVVDFSRGGERDQIAQTRYCASSSNIRFFTAGASAR